MTYGESAVTETIARLLGDSPDLNPTVDGSLDNLDQYHVGGGAAVDLLIPTLALTEGEVVLDVGSGFGGPARQIARRTGNRVIGIDITAAYVDAARDLTVKAGLSDLVDFEAVDVTAFEHETPFQAAITMHVQMNIRDKAAWFEHIAKHLAPGSRLGVWELCQPEQTELAWPMPWSLDGSDNFITTPAALVAAIEEAGFSATAWTQKSAWAQDWFAKVFADGMPTGPALPMLLDDGYTRVINLAGAISNGSIQVWQGSFTKNVE